MTTFLESTHSTDVWKCKQFFHIFNPLGVMIFENSLKLSKNAKITDSSEIKKKIVQINVFWTILMSALEKVLNKLGFWKCLFLDFGSFQKMLTFGARKTQTVNFFFLFLQTFQPSNYTVPGLN